jgi:hypothetical protein
MFFTKPLFCVRAGWILGLLWMTACPVWATRWTLVDFGTNPATCVTPYPNWNQVIFHPTRSQFVDPDGNPDHAGITIRPGLGETERSYFGIRGTVPIQFRPGHEIICTMYNRTDETSLPRMRISFTDANEPDPGDPDHPWFTIYNSSIHINTDWAQPRSLVELRYYIQDEAMLAAINGMVSTGAHDMVNVSFAEYETTEPALVLTKIEFSDEADLTPPTRPASLQASMIRLSNGASSNVVRLTWNASTDPGAHATGVSRYYIYRDGSLYDVLSQEMTEYLGTNLQYLDLSAAPDSTHAYQVSAIDKAQYGLYPRLGRPPCHPANESELSSTVTVTTPPWHSTTLLNPWTDFVYAGGFRLPLTSAYDWSYASAGLTWHPHGNPGRNPSNELSGSLYALSRTQTGVGSFTIPRPVRSSNLNDWPRAETLIPVTTNIWPRVYDGNAIPAGGGEFAVASLTYHPGGHGVSERLYYGICNFYATDPAAPSHGWFDLALAGGHGAWHIGGQPPDNICPSLTARYMCQIPQAWADAHTDGRSLLIGNNFLSGGPENYNGPNVFVIAPWASGSLPENGGDVPASLMLQYSPIGTLSNQVPNWRIDRNAEGAVWLDVGGKSALAISYRRPMGDVWYGDTAGNNYTFYNIPAAPSEGEGAGASFARNEWLLYAPDDLADVLHGRKQSWQPMPYASYDPSIFSFRTNRADYPSGALCYSTADGVLFMMEHNGDLDEMNGENGLVHAWRAVVTAAPVMRILPLSGDQLQVGWTTASNSLAYYLQRSISLADPGWTDIAGPVTGDGSNKTHTVTFGTNAACFYRINIR